MENDLDEIIRRFARLHLRRMELANIQNSRKGTLRPVLKTTKIPGRARISAVLFSATILDAFYGFSKVWFFYCSSPDSFQSEKYRLTWDGKCEKFSVLIQLFSWTQFQRPLNSGFQVTGMIEWGQKSKPKKIPERKFIPQKIPCRISEP